MSDRVLGESVLGDDGISIKTALGTFRVRIDRFRRTRLTDAQRSDGRRLARQLRFGLDCGAPDLLMAAQRLQHQIGRAQPDGLRPPHSTHDMQRQLLTLGDFLADELDAGRLVVVREAEIAKGPEQELGARRPKVEERAKSAELSPRRSAPLLTSFEVRFVDEIGQPISPIEVEIKAGDRTERVTTNAAGVALLDGTTAGSGTVKVLDPVALELILALRWAKPRFGALPGGLHKSEHLFDGERLDATAIKAGVSNIVVIKPMPLEFMFQLLDQDGGPVTGRKFSLKLTSGEEREGTTDAAGFGCVTDVPRSDRATLSFLDLDASDFATASS